MQKAPQHFEPGIWLQQTLPQVAGGVLDVVGRHWVAGTTFLAAEVKGQEKGVLARQFRGHRHLILPYGKMHQRATLEGQQWLRLARQRVFHRAVVTVLALGVFHRLLELAFQLQRGGGDAVDEQHQIKPRVIARSTAAGLSCIRRIGHLRHHAQAVALVALKGVRVHYVVRLKATQLHLDRRQLEAMAQHIQGTALLLLAHQFLHKHAFRVVWVGLAEFFPTIRPSFLEITQQIFSI
ncbi:hypothetical protein D3C85_440270 [compost metagenome]